MTKTRLDAPSIVRTCWKPSDALRKIPACQRVRATNLGSSPAQISPRHVSDGMSHSLSEALALAPAGAVRNGASLTIVERFKSIVAMRLDKPPHLFNGLPGFRRFRSAALAYPLFERPGRRRRRLALAPRRHAQQGRQLARRRNQAEPLRRPIDLAIRARRHVSGNKLANVAANVIARHLFIDEPSDEFRPGNAISRDRRLFERLGQLARVIVRPGMIENAKAAIGRNIQHAHQLAGARLARPIFRRVLSRQLFRPSTAP